MHHFTSDTKNGHSVTMLFHRRSRLAKLIPHGLKLAVVQLFAARLKPCHFKNGVMKQIHVFCRVRPPIKASSLP